jgi:hypothetical protein
MFLFIHNTEKPTLKLWNELETFPKNLLYEISKLVILIMLVNDPRKASRVPSSQLWLMFLQSTFVGLAILGIS